MELVNKKMGMAVGALFIRDNFDPKSKETALEMIHNIRNAFNELLSLNEWMDEPTVEVAREKANSINERIGYPDFLTNPIELSKEYQLVSYLSAEALLLHRFVCISLSSDGIPKFVETFHHLLVFTRDSRNLSTFLIRFEFQSHSSYAYLFSNTQTHKL